MVNVRWGAARSILGFTPSSAETVRDQIDAKAVATEFVSTFLFVTVGCGAAVAQGLTNVESRLGVAFAFGMSAMAIAYSIGHHSGCHLNCAVTFSLWMGNHISWYQGLANTIAQLIASVFSAILLMIIFPCSRDFSGNLGSNVVNPEYGPLRVLVSEAIGTYLWCFIVWQTSVTPQASCGKNAVLAIGFTIFVAHLVLIPMDGCSINPTRSFGPAIVSQIRNCENFVPGGLPDLWVMWLGPLLGAAAAAGVQKIFAPDLAELKRSEKIEQERLHADDVYSIAVMDAYVLDEQDTSTSDTEVKKDTKAEPRESHDGLGNRAAKCFKSPY